MIIEGSLQRKKNSKYWQAVFYVNGKQKWKSTKIEAKKGNIKRAKAVLAEFIRQYSDEAYTDDFFTDFLKQWLTDIKPTIKPSTWEGYEKVVKGKLIPYFEDKKYKLCDLKGMYFTQYFTYLKEHGRADGKGGLKKKAILNIRGVLSSALKYAHENELVTCNYIDRSKMPVFDDEDSFEAVIYTDEQVKQLLQYARDTESDMYLFLSLLLSTGCRKGELLALTWSDVDFDNSTILIQHNKTGSKKEVLNKLTTPKSNNSVRTLTLPDSVMLELHKELEHQQEMKKVLGEEYIIDKYDYVIRKPGGGCYNPNSINRIIKKMMVKLELPICRLHDFRHLVASKMFEQGTPLADITLQLGHGQTGFTERQYITKKKTAKAEPVLKMVSAFGIE